MITQEIGTLFHECEAGQPAVNLDDERIPLFVVGGLTPTGARAASELVAEARYLSSVLEDAPHQWSQMNMEAVIETSVTNGEADSRKVVATQYW
ncbi:MAG TPA: hypothetical protein VE195_06760 [Acidobacteriaceae bacterium]|nr:hypothetical protein [Acidobacteriaceae bacterium]